MASAFSIGSVSWPAFVFFALVVESFVSLVARSAAVWVVDSAVRCAVELDCMSRQAQVVSVLVAETAAGLVACLLYASYAAAYLLF